MPSRTTSRPRAQRQTARRGANNAARRKRRARKRSRRRTGWSWLAWRRRPSRAALPGWQDLEAGKQTQGPRQPPAGAFLERISVLRFGLLLLLIVVALAAYVGHVHATQQLLADVQQARQDNLRLHLKHNRLKGEFDQATGPAVIYERARALGLEDDITYAPTIRVPE
jgi:cell division protein FtsB